MTAKELAALLRAAEQAHAASGHDASDWAEWYAQWLLPMIEARYRAEQLQTSAMAQSVLKAYETSERDGWNAR